MPRAGTARRRCRAATGSLSSFKSSRPARRYPDLVPIVRPALAADLPELAEVAALPFPLACPPHTTDAAKAAFIAAHLTETSFAGYLADAARDVLVAEVDGRIAGYVMLIE